MAHIVRLLGQNDLPCLEVHVPKDKLRISVELFQQLYPGERLWIDGAVVQLAGGVPPTDTGATPGGAAPAPSPAPPRAASPAPPVQAQPSDPTLAHMNTILQMNAMLLTEHMAHQQRLTDDMVQQYRKVRASLEEVDLMARGARVIEFQEMLRGIQAMNASTRIGSPEERRSWNSEQLERFVIGGLKAAKIIQDA